MKRYKGDFVDFVLVCNVSDNSKPYYYAGHYGTYAPDVIMRPVNTQDYTKAMKMPYREEAQALADIINRQRSHPFQYQVEEHMYVKGVPVEVKPTSTGLAGSQGGYTNKGWQS